MTRKEQRNGEEKAHHHTERHIQKGTSGPVQKAIAHAAACPEEEVDQRLLSKGGGHPFSVDGVPPDSPLDHFSPRFGMRIPDE